MLYYPYMKQLTNKNLISFSFVLTAVFTFGLFVTAPKSASAYYGSSEWVGEQFVGHCDSTDTYNGSGYNNNSYYNNNYYNNNNGGNYYGTNPIPYVSTITPNSGNLNATSTAITISGSSFIQGSIVRWNNSDRQTTFINGGTLRVQLESYDLASTGSFPISVINPAPGGGISNTVLFTVVNNSSAVASSASGTSSGTNTSATKTTTVKKSTSTSNTTATSTTSQQPTTGKEVGSLAAGAIFGSNGFLPSSIFQWIFFFIMVLLAVILWRKLYISDEERRAKPLKHA